MITLPAFRTCYWRYGVLLAVCTVVYTTLLRRAYAAETFSEFVSNRVVPIFDAVIALAMVLAIIFFSIGVVRFMYTSGDDRSRESGKSMMVWGTLAIVLMVSIWGIVRIIKNTFFG